MTKENIKNPVYEIGNSDPVMFTSSPLNTTIKFMDIVLGNVQSIEFKAEVKDFYTVQENKLTFIDIIPSYERKKWSTGQMVKKIGILELESKINHPDLDKPKNTQILCLRKMKIKFTRFYMRLSVDDLVGEYSYNFEILEELDA